MKGFVRNTFILPYTSNSVSVRYRYNQEAQHLAKSTSYLDTVKTWHQFDIVQTNTSSFDIVVSFATANEYQLAPNRTEHLEFFQSYSRAVNVFNPGIVATGWGSEAPKVVIGGIIGTPRAGKSFVNVILSQMYQFLTRSADEDKESSSEFLRRFDCENTTLAQQFPWVHRFAMLDTRGRYFDITDATDRKWLETILDGVATGSNLSKGNPIDSLQISTTNQISHAVITISALQTLESITGIPGTPDWSQLTFDETKVQQFQHLHNFVVTHFAKRAVGKENWVNLPEDRQRLQLLEANAKVFVVVSHVDMLSNDKVTKHQRRQALVRALTQVPNGIPVRSITWGEKTCQWTADTLMDWKRTFDNFLASVDKDKDFLPQFQAAKVADSKLSLHPKESLCTNSDVCLKGNRPTDLHPFTDVTEANYRSVLSAFFQSC